MAKKMQESSASASGPEDSKNLAATIPSEKRPVIDPWLAPDRKPSTDMRSTLP